MLNKSQSRTVYVLDDDLQCIKFATHLLGSQGYGVRKFTLPEDAIDAVSHAGKRHESALLIDVHMPTMSGLEVLDQLHRHGVFIPAIYMSAHADVPSAIAVMGRGAITLLEKPLERVALMRAMSMAFSKSMQLRRSVRADRCELVRTQAQLGSLTNRESEIVRGLLADLSNVEIARECNISIKTVELYRSKVMTKLGAKNAAHLVRMVLSHEYMRY